MSSPATMSVVEFMRELQHDATEEPRRARFTKKVEEMVEDIVRPHLTSLKEKQPASPFPFSVTARHQSKSVERVTTETARINNVWVCLNGISPEGVKQFISSGATPALTRAPGSAGNTRISVGGGKEQYAAHYVELSGALLDSFNDMYRVVAQHIDQPVEGARVVRMLTSDKQHLGYIIPYLQTSDGGLALISDFGPSAVLQKDLFFRPRHACEKCHSQCPREFVPKMNAWWCTACTDKFNEELDGEELETTDDAYTIGQAQARQKQDEQYLHGPYHTAPCAAEYEFGKNIMKCGKGPTVEWNNKFYCLQCWEESGEVPDTEIFPLGTRKSKKDEPCELVGWTSAEGWRRCGREPACYKRGLFHCRLCWAAKFSAPFPEDASPSSSSSSSA